MYRVLIIKTTDEPDMQYHYIWNVYVSGHFICWKETPEAAQGIAENLGKALAARVEHHDLTDTDADELDNAIQRILSTGLTSP